MRRDRERKRKRRAFVVNENVTRDKMRPASRRAQIKISGDSEVPALEPMAWQIYCR